MAEQPAQTVRFAYLKSNLFRVVHVDGVIGGLTPTRDIFVSLYNQRVSLPDITEQVVLPDGSLGEEVAVKADEELVREVEVGLIMSLNTAEEFAHFLLERATLLRELDENRP